jgi:hypothetical protein
MKKYAKIFLIEFEPVILNISATIVFGLLSIFGMVYNLGKSIKESFQWKFWRGISKFIIYWLRVFYQFWVVYKYLSQHLAIAKDLFANVSSGEMLEDIITDREDTLFGRGDITISAATGYLELIPDLNPRGLWFTRILSKALGKNHSVNAYQDEINKKVIVLK